MILYKYLTLYSAKKTISNNNVQFSDAVSFNDPFEISLHNKAKEDTNNDFNVDIGPLLMRVSELGKSNGYATCCLTRSPLNPLMWSHYGDSHKGIVIGYETDGSILEDSDNLISASHGAVIYTGTRHLITRSSDEAYKEKISDLNYIDLQRMFLQKAGYWSYEEEVRVIRPTSKMTKVDQYYYRPSMPNGAIKEIYLGCNFLKYDFEERISFFLLLSELNPKCKIYRCSTEPDSWNITGLDYNQEAENTLLTARKDGAKPQDYQLV